MPYISSFQAVNNYVTNNPKSHVHLQGYNGLKPGWTRISFSYYMSVTEFEFLLAAIEFIAVYGQRFLPLYHFNWKTGDWTFRKTALQKLVGEERALALNSLKLAGGMRTLGVRGYRSSESPSTPRSQTHGSGVDMEHKYAIYLETARYVARSLPKFPPQRRVPEGVDIDLVLFRI